MMFSSGLPLLYPVAFISFFVTYWFDKMMSKLIFDLKKLVVLKFYRTPQSLPLEFSEMLILVIQYSAIPHCIIGYLMYNNSNILPLR